MVLLAWGARIGGQWRISNHKPATWVITAPILVLHHDHLYRVVRGCVESIRTHIDGHRAMAIARSGRPCTRPASDGTCGTPGAMEVWGRIKEVWGWIMEVWGRIQEVWDWIMEVWGWNMKVWGWITLGTQRLSQLFLHRRWGIVWRGGTRPGRAKDGGI